MFFISGFEKLIRLVRLIVANNPRLLFMVSLVRTLRRNKRRGYHHWDEIIPGKVILSAIPAFSHLEELTTPREKGGVGITGVVTVLRDCELGPSFLYRPVQKSEWNNKQVEVLHIEAGDYTPVSVEKLIEGADFIHEKVGLSSSDRWDSNSNRKDPLGRKGWMCFDSLQSWKRSQLHCLCCLFDQARKDDT